MFIVILGIGAGIAYARFRIGANMEAGGIGVAAFIISLVVY
jgi:hypothetical protein